MIRTINRLNIWAAQALKPAPDGAMISISDSSTQGFALPGWEQILYLRFDDLNHPTEFNPNKPLRCFNEDMARQVAAFVQTLQDTPRALDLNIHCHAGVSRSAAIALWVSKTYGIALPENFKLMTSPNVLVLKHLFSLSLGKPVDIQERRVFLPGYDPDADEIFDFNDPPRCYSEFEVLDQEGGPDEPVLLVC